MSKNNCHIIITTVTEQPRMGISNKIRNLSCKKFYYTRSSPLISVIYRNILRLHIKYTYNLIIIQIMEIIIIPFKYVYTGRKLIGETDFEFIEECYHRNFTWTRRDIPYRVPLCAHAPFTWIKTLPLSFIFQRYISTGSERSSRHNRQYPLRTTARNLDPSSRESHRYIEHKEWRTALFSARISRLLPDSVGDDLLLTPTPTLFFVKRMARSSASADLRNAKLCGLYSHGRVITFPWPPYPPCPPPFSSLSLSPPTLPPRSVAVSG